MNVDQIIDIAATMFGDPQQTHIQYADWITIANKSERELARLTESIVSRVDCQDFVEGQTLYDTTTGNFFGDYDIIQVIRLIRNGYEMHSVQEWQMINIGRSFRSSDVQNGEPELFYMSRNGQLGIYRPPNSNHLTNIQAEISHLPTAEMIETVDPTPASIPELPVIFHDDLAMYMCYLGCIIDKERERAEYVLGLVRESLKKNIVRYNTDRNHRIDTDVVDFERFTDDL